MQLLCTASGLAVAGVLGALLPFAAAYGATLAAPSAASAASSAAPASRPAGAIGANSPTAANPAASEADSSLGAPDDRSEAQLRRDVDTIRETQEKEITLAKATGKPPLADPGRAAWIARTYAALNLRLAADIQANAGGDPALNRELRADLENYRLEQRIALANEQALGDARARAAAAQLPTTGASAAPSAPATSALPATPALTLDPVAFANHCLEAGTCKSAVSIYDTPSGAANAASANYAASASDNSVTSTGQPNVNYGAAISAPAITTPPITTPIIALPKTETPTAIATSENAPSTTTPASDSASDAVGQSYPAVTMTFAPPENTTPTGP